MAFTVGPTPPKTTTAPATTTKTGEVANTAAPATAANSATTNVAPGTQAFIAVGASTNSADERFNLFLAEALKDHPLGQDKEQLAKFAEQLRNGGSLASLSMLNSYSSRMLPKA